MVSMALSEQEVQWLTELRTVELGNPTSTIQTFSYAATDDTARVVEQFANHLLDLGAMTDPDTILAIVLAIAPDPKSRRDQYFSLLQVISERLGPKEHEDFQYYFDSKLILQ